MANRIPRKFHVIKAEAVSETSANKPGEIVYIFKDDDGYILRKPGCKTVYRTFASHLRNENLYRFINVCKAY